MTMAIGVKRTTTSSPLFLLFTLFLITAQPQPSHSLPIPISSFHSLFSLSHSLLTRVANLRAARGDVLGSDRARLIAQKIEQRGQGLSFYGVMWSVGWDYLKNYAWRDVGTSSFEMFGAVSDMNELMRALNELTRLESDVERVSWVRQNYGSVIRVSKSLFVRLLKVFRQSGPLKEAIQMVQTEIVDGDLLRDCLELGSSDLKGVVQILKDVASQFSSTSSKTEL